MPNLEVISLSVNKISSLRDFRHCQKLQVSIFLIILGTVLKKECHIRPKRDKISHETSCFKSPLVTW